MRDRLGMIILAVAAVLLVGIVLLVVLRSRPQPPANGELPPTPVNEGAPDGEQAPEDEPDIEVSGTELTIEEEGEVVWRASFGGEIELNEENNVARATEVTWEFEGEGFEGLTLEAPLMRADWNEGRLYFSEGIAIEGEGGELQFTAETAVYQFDTHKIIGRGDVRFRRGNFYGRAEEVVVDNDRKTVRLKRGSLTRVH